jgi:hypothetical protein
MRKTVAIALILTIQLLLRAPIHAQDVKPPAGADSAEVKSDAGGWRNLFDGKTLTGWATTKYARGGKVHLESKFRDGDAAILIDAGGALSGFNWTGESVPKTNYEIELEAMKLKGDDFMCGLTFPVGESHASLILGGWGGYITGISSLDNMDASENETQKSITYEKDRWYKVRMRVMRTKLQAWLDGKKIIDVDTTGRKISLRIGEIEMSVPIGICTYKTDAAYRNIRLRSLTPKEIASSSAKTP